MQDSRKVEVFGGCLFLLSIQHSGQAGVWAVGDACWAQNSFGTGPTSCVLGLYYLL